MSKILVTGGSGFLGRYIATAATLKGHDVTTMDIAPGSDMLKSCQDLVNEEVMSFDAVFHLACMSSVMGSYYSPRCALDQTVGSTLGLLEACKPWGTRIMLMGCAAEYWIDKFPITEDVAIKPHNIYSLMKHTQEEMVMTYGHLFRLPVMSLASGTVIGPYMRKDVFIYQWIRNILLGQPVTLMGGAQTRDITYISDTVDAWMLALNKPELTGEKFYITRGEEWSLEDLLNLCFKICGKEVHVNRVPYRPSEINQRLWYSNEKASRLLGYKPKIDVIAAVEYTAAWIEGELKNESNKR